MRLSPLYLTFLFELCLLGLANFLGPLLFWTFWRFYSKGGECGTKATKWFQSGRGKLRVNIGREDQKGGKFDLGGVCMMVSIQASVSGSNFVNLCKLMLVLVVLS
jgi:hypothetical protein